VLLGAFSGLAGEISLPSVVSAIRDKFTGKVAEGNIAAAAAAFEQVRAQLAACQQVKEQHAAHHQEAR
jgi:pyruvate ferredoxin oxidoreductase gamma subunit